MARVKLAIDFDSSFTCVYMSENGIVLKEPTVAAVDEAKNGEVKAIGLEAKRMMGKTSKTTKIVFPIFEGEVVNEKVATSVLSGFLKKIGIKNTFIGAEAVFPVPCGATASILEKYKSVASKAGLGKVYFVETPYLSALGQRIPFNESAPCFIIDMAGGVTNIAALSLDGIIAGVSVNMGANKICADIIDFIAERYSLQIGLLTAERLRDEIGSLDDYDGLSTVVNGRDLRTGSPTSMTIKACDIIEPVKVYFDKIAEIALSVLYKLPPEVSAEIRHAGIYLSGIASKVYDLEKYYKQKFGINVKVAENADVVVALGGGIAQADKEVLKKIALKVK